MTTVFETLKKVFIGAAALLCAFITIAVIELMIKYTGFEVAQGSITFFVLLTMLAYYIGNEYSSAKKEMEYIHKLENDLKECLESRKAFQDGNKY